MRAKQRGVALIVILLLLAVMVSIAATMAERLFSQFQRATHQLNYQQAYWYSLGVEALAKKGIEQSYQDSETINLSQPWALKEQTYPLDYGQVRGKIRDMQACFNLNALAGVKLTPDSVKKPYLLTVLQALLEGLEVESYQAEVIADSTLEFIDKDDSVRTAYGVEDSYYESMIPAYMAADTWLADASEWRAVQQVGGETMNKALPYVCALPTDQWRLNVNTLPAEQAALLAVMFSPTLSTESAKTLLEGRPFDGWASVDDFLAQSALTGVDNAVREEAKKYLSVDSHYFELDAQVLVDTSRVRIRSLFYSNDKKTATVIRRRFGGISERVSDRSTE
ncbi:type II secretion system minor pseudopilin GspK [Vibrio cholerae]|nr:general secretion pathway protein GspK [Vibrio cholerae]EKF9087169.1 type II secretion system minor pseudopilin GspK [Vibrio cholerae]EMA2409041.1 type II secretion system minor pseudopilin GspK [Vibrio cholerae]GIB09657.1 general secretion pathway protein K [Vibrio cholerae]